MILNIQKVQEAVDLQKRINSEIEEKGSASYYDCKVLDRLIDNFSSAEDELFIELMNQ